MMFDQLEWAHDERSFTLAGRRFKVEQALDDDDAESFENEFFRFYKPRSMVEQYRRFFESRPGWSPERVFELGIWNGGSIAFWTTLLRPQMMVAIDYVERDDPTPLQAFRGDAGDTAIHTYWGVDQADHVRLEAILDGHGNPALDLVIDDASHKYRQTVASFNTLFPRVGNGGAYIIEDWSWSYDEQFVASHPDWAANEPMAPIVMGLAALAATVPGYVAEVRVFRDFLVVLRGADSTGPVLESATPTVPTHSPIARQLGGMARQVRRVMRSLKRT